MNRVSAVMPTTSDAIPLIGKESNNQTDKKSYLSFANKTKKVNLCNQISCKWQFFSYMSFYITVSQIKPNLNTTFFYESTILQFNSFDWTAAVRCLAVKVNEHVPTKPHRHFLHFCNPLQTKETFIWPRSWKALTSYVSPKAHENIIVTGTCASLNSEWEWIICIQKWRSVNLVFRLI